MQCLLQSHYIVATRALALCPWRAGPVFSRARSPLARPRCLSHQAPCAHMNRRSCRRSLFDTRPRGGWHSRLHALESVVSRCGHMRRRKAFPNLSPPNPSAAIDSRHRHPSPHTPSPPLRCCQPTSRPHTHGTCWVLAHARSHTGFRAAKGVLRAPPSLPPFPCRGPGQARVRAPVPRHRRSGRRSAQADAQAGDLTLAGGAAFICSSSSGWYLTTMAASSL